MNDQTLSARKTASTKAGYMQRMVTHPAYVLAVILVVMPMVGAIIERGEVWLGVMLITMQAPWAICRAYEIWAKNNQEQ